MQRVLLRGLRCTAAAVVAWCSLPLGVLESSAAASAADLAITTMTWEQNGDHLSPRAEAEDGTQQELTVSAADNTANGLRQAQNLPSAYSLLDVAGESYVTSVKDQGSTGLCWAYSALGACESNILKQGLTIPTDWEDDKGELNLSEGALGWYIYTGHWQSGDFTSGDYLSLSGKGSGGGNAAIAGFALAAGMGVQLEQDVPTDAWSDGYSEYQRFSSCYRMKSYDLIWQLESGSESIIKGWIQDSGAVSASFYSDDTFYENDTSIAYYQNTHSAEDASHAILLVGWDDNYSRTNFQSGQQPKQNGAWLVRNSWGDGDAYEGYFWISYEETSLCEFARYEMEENTGSQTCYQYDGSVSYTGVKTTEAANVFTADADGVLDSVMFPMLSRNPDQADYIVSVYRLDDDAQTPGEGTLLCTNTGTVSYGGYKNVPVRAVSVKKGERFAVTLQLTDTTDGDTLYVAMESNSTGSSPAQHCSCQTGQTYLKGGDSNWYDIKELATIADSSGTKPFADVGNTAIKVIVDTSDTDVNRTQLNSALAYGAPTSNASTLYRQAYNVAQRLSTGITQTEVDYAAKNLLTGLEQSGRLTYPHLLYANYSWQQGDVNEDGAITIKDAFQALLESSFAASGSVGLLHPAQVMAADVDSNDQVEIRDAFYILLYNSVEAANGDAKWEDVIPS